MIMHIREQFQQLLIHLTTAGCEQWSQSGIDILDQRRTPHLGIQPLLHLLPERFHVLRQKARSIVVIELRFLRQSLPDPVILAVGGLPLQLPSANTYLYHVARIPLAQSLIALLRSLVIVPIALCPGGEARQRQRDFLTPQLAPQFQNRLQLRLPRRALWDASLAVE